MDEQKPNNWANITITKSSSKDGGVGYSVNITTDGSIGQVDLNEIAAKALTTALKVKEELTRRGI